MMNGFTLLELLAVLTIIAILAVVASPGFLANHEQQRLRAASQEVINALRFARSESVRTNRYHAVKIQLNSTISVYDLANPNDALDVASLALHPHNKFPYSSLLSEQASSRGVEFQSVGGIFQFGAGSYTNSLYFTPQGRPFVHTPSNAKARLLMVNLILKLGGFSRAIQVDSVSGRVVADEV